MKLLIAGDLVIDKPYNINNLSIDLISLFKNSDLNIVNLEAPVTSSSAKILKTGPHLKADKENTVKVLKALEIDMVTLATNHILDFGDEGLLDTLDLCKTNSIEFVGVGKNLLDSAKYKVRKINGRNISIINFAENEWGNADEYSSGANPMDLISNYNQIKDANSKTEIVIVIVHGGNQFYNLPSPEMQRKCRFYVDCGADIVVCHHTHCISGFETYKGKNIYYGLGNFLFTDKYNHEEWYKGMILEVEVPQIGEIKSRVHPIELGEDFSLKLMENRSKTELLKEFYHYSDIIKDERKLKEAWHKFIDKNYKGYLRRWSITPHVRNKYVKYLLLYFGIDKLFNNKMIFALRLNLMRCESHHELSKAVLQRYLNENSKPK